MKDTASQTANKSFFKSAGVISFFTLLSRISGLFRDVVLAHVIGAGPVADAFVIAFRIPNVIRRFTGEGTLTVSFIPVYKGVMVSGDEVKRKKFLIGSLSITVIGMGLIIALCYLFSPILVKLFAPGFKSWLYPLTLSLFHIMLPYLFFIVLVAYFMGFLNSHGHFAAPSAAPILLNLFIIAGALAGYYISLHHAVYFIAVSVSLAGFFQFLMQVPPSLKRRFPFRLTLKKEVLLQSEIIEAGRMLVPSVLSASAYQINLLITGALASFLPHGSIAYLYYGVRFLELPLGLFVFAISMALLPVLSEHGSKGKKDEFSRDLASGISGVLLFTIPATAGLLLLAPLIVRAFFMHGEFGMFAAVQTAYAVRMYALGMVGVGLYRVLLQGFYAVKKPEVPLKSAYIALLVNAGCSLALMFPLKHGGLALATGIAAFVQTFYLYLKIKKEPVWDHAVVRPILGSVLRYLIAAGLMSGFIFALNRSNFAPKMGSLLLLLVDVAGGSLLYFAVLHLTRDKLWLRMVDVFLRRVRK